MDYPIKIGYWCKTSPDRLQSHTHDLHASIESCLLYLILNSVSISISTYSKSRKSVWSNVECNGGKRK